MVMFMMSFPIIGSVSCIPYSSLTGLFISRKTAAAANPNAQKQSCTAAPPVPIRALPETPAGNSGYERHSQAFARSVISFMAVQASWPHTSVQTLPLCQGHHINLAGIIFSPKLLDHFKFLEAQRLIEPVCYVIVGINAHLHSFYLHE